MLEEARHLLKQFRANNVEVSGQIYRTILEMMTVNPARVTKMSIGELKDNFGADFWIGRFPKSLLFR
jgi:cytosine/adenosine deaminase-related metal-dependent hydrolase